MAGKGLKGQSLLQQATHCIIVYCVGWGGGIRLNISHELSTHEILSLIWLLLKKHNKILKCFLLIFLGDLWVESLTVQRTVICKLKLK